MKKRANYTPATGLEVISNAILGLPETDDLLPTAPLTPALLMDRVLTGYTTADGKRTMAAVGNRVARILFKSTWTSPEHTPYAALDPEGNLYRGANIAPWVTLAGSPGVDACRHLRGTLKELVREADKTRGDRSLTKKSWGVSRSTANRAMVFTRRMLTVLRQEGAMDDHHLALCKAELKSLPVTPRDTPLGLDEAALDALRAGFAKLPPAMAAREQLVLCLLSCGLRRGEIAGLQWGDIKHEGTTVGLQVLGKGDKWRCVPLPDRAAPLLDLWRFFCSTDLGDKSTESGQSLLRRVNKSGVIGTAGITGHGLYQTMSRRLKAAGLPHVGLHEFRRLFATTLLERGVPLTVVADLAGHASLDTTRLYARHGFKARCEAMELTL